MKLLPATGEADESDPRERESAEIIDLASRTSYPVVANRNNRSDALTLVAGAGAVALIGAAVFFGLNAGNTAEEAQLAEQNAEANAPDTLPVTPGTSPTDGLPLANADGEVMVEPVDDGLIEPVDFSTSPDAEGFTGPAPSSSLNSPTLIFDNGSAPRTSAPGPKLTEATSSTEAASGDGGGGANDFAARIGGVGGGTATARRDFNVSTTVTQGTIIPAILETAINTDIPGFARAVVSQDVRSHDGSRVLIPRSSRLVGQYQSGLQAGQRRAYVIWQRLIRPDGVSVSLQSPATAFDGTTGLEGEVDTHFFSRFGSAMLLSVIGGLTNIAGGGASVILGGGQSAASTALQQDGQRSPTIRVGMGEPVRVYTARDLDFGSAPPVR